MLQNEPILLLSVWVITLVHMYPRFCSYDSVDSLDQAFAKPVFKGSHCQRKNAGACNKTISDARLQRSSLKCRRRKRRRRKRRRRGRRGGGGKGKWDKKEEEDKTISDARSECSSWRCSRNRRRRRSLVQPQADPVKPLSHNFSVSLQVLPKCPITISKRYVHFE